MHSILINLYTLASSKVTNFSAIASTASRILVHWDTPLYPNGPITYFKICMNTSYCNNVSGSAAYYLLNGLISLETYYITVQPFTIFGNVSLKGEISENEEVIINTTASDITNTNYSKNVVGSSITIQLLSYKLFSADVV